MASKAQKRKRLHQKRMQKQAAQAKPQANSYEQLKKRCSANVAKRKRTGEAKRDFWKDYGERFGSWSPPPEPEGPLQGSCAKKSIFEDHLFKK